MQAGGERTLCAEPYLDTARGVQLKPGDLCAMHVCLEALYSFTCDQPCRKSRKLQRKQGSFNWMWPTKT